MWGKPKDVGRKVRKAKDVYRSETSSLFRTSVVLRGSGPVIVVPQFFKYMSERDFHNLPKAKPFVLRIFISWDVTLSLDNIEFERLMIVAHSFQI